MSEDTLNPCDDVVTRRVSRYETNTDKKVVVLKFTDLDGDGVGMIRYEHVLGSACVSDLPV